MMRTKLPAPFYFILIMLVTASLPVFISYFVPLMTLKNRLRVPDADYRIPASDSTSMPGNYIYRFEKEIAGGPIVSANYACTGNSSLVVQPKKPKQSVVSIPLRETGFRGITGLGMQLMLLFPGSEEQPATIAWGISGKYSDEVLGHLEISSEETGTGRWTAVQTVVFFPDTAGLNEKTFRLWFINRGNENFYVDDLRLSFIFPGEEVLPVIPLLPSDTLFRLPCDWLDPLTPSEESARSGSEPKMEQALPELLPPACPEIFPCGVMNLVS